MLRYAQHDRTVTLMESLINVFHCIRGPQWCSDNLMELFAVQRRLFEDRGEMRLLKDVLIDVYVLNISLRLSTYVNE